MTMGNESVPSFNLWTEPWIALEDNAGGMTQCGIRNALLNAHEYVAIYDPSPLVVVGVHRLLMAILQDALNPQENDDLERLWKLGRFPANKIDRFGKQYADRFDLFSEDRPFLQSADLPLFATTNTDRQHSKSAAQLFPDTPSGSLITHYHHGTESEQIFSPAMIAAGLVTIPPFVSSGGAGLMPSINGVPPIYVLPGGKTLFESLAASLITATLLGDDYASTKGDRAWWKRDVPVIIQKSKKKNPGMSSREHRQLREVGYIHGLTFPARKLRLHPERLNAACSRSGRLSEWCVRTMTFQMGESRLEEAPVWRDPFAGYRLPVKPKADSKRKSAPLGGAARDKPKPIRPVRGRATWREFTGLFLQQRQERQSWRPLFLDQLSLLSIAQRLENFPFRCVAFQTDGKMKYYEWLDFGLDVPPALLQDPDGARWTEQALSFGTDCAATITRVFSATFGRKTKNAERFEGLKERLEAEYWAVLAGEFREFVLALGDGTRQQQILEAWLDTVVREGQSAFDSAADATGDDGNTLRQIVQGKDECWKQLNILRSRLK